MTLMRIKEVTCHYCEQKSEQMVMTSSNEQGSRDLDFRPAEMYRSTMDVWLKECPHCHFVSDDLGVKSAGFETIPAAKYMSVLANSAYPSVARKFLAYALIMEEENPEVAGYARLRAAWACDDEQLNELANQCRFKAVQTLIACTLRWPEERQIDNNLVIIDMLRRLGKFDVANDILSSFLMRDGLTEIILNICQFQKALIERREMGVYTVDDAVNHAALL